MVCKCSDFRHRLTYNHNFFRQNVSEIRIFWLDFRHFSELSPDTFGWFFIDFLMVFVQNSVASHFKDLIYYNYCVEEHITNVFRLFMFLKTEPTKVQISDKFGFQSFGFQTFTVYWNDRSLFLIQPNEPVDFSDLPFLFVYFLSSFFLSICLSVCRSFFLFFKEIMTNGSCRSVTYNSLIKYLSRIL